MIFRPFVPKGIDMRTTLDLRAVTRVVDVRDLIGLASFAAILIGLSQWSRPLAWVAGGMLGLAFWCFPYVRRRKGDSA